jgi:hypothetical protein
LIHFVGICNIEQNPLAKVFEQLVNIGQAEYHDAAERLVRCSLERFDYHPGAFSPAAWRLWTTWAPRIPVDKGKLKKRIYESLRQCREEYAKGEKSMSRTILNLAGFCSLTATETTRADVIYRVIDQSALRKSEVSSQR